MIMKNNPIGIVGYGVVGKALEHGFKGEPIFIYDKYQETATLEEVCQNSEFIFLGLPTPIFSDESGIDLSIVNSSVAEIAPLIENTDKILIIKSTVIPGTTRRLSQEYPNVNFAFNPEFLTEANFLNDFMNADRTIIGAESHEVSARMAELYKKHFPNQTIFQTDPTTAEMVKYMANCYLAMKVTFANEMSDLCEKLEINYPEVKALVTKDHRIYDSHLDITPQKGFGGKCLPKDLLALRALAKSFEIDTTILDAVWDKNSKRVAFRDWEGINGAVTKKSDSEAN